MPVDSCPLTFDEIIAKDVPKGYKYKIVNKDEVPTDRSFRDAWTVADSDLTDGVGISTTALPYELSNGNNYYNRYGKSQRNS